MGFIEQSTVEGRSMYRASARGQSFLRQYYILLSLLMTSEKDARRLPLIYEAQPRRRSTSSPSSQVSQYR
jgi:hypothetical protein